MLGLSSITGSGSTGSTGATSSLIGSTGSFVILVLGFACAFALDFALTGFASSKIVSTTAS